MRTLIVPCIGRKIINDIPQYLNRHPNGKLLLERSFEGIYNDDYNRILIVILKSDEENYNVKSILENELSQYPIKVVTLENMTSGPAETVYKAVKKANISGSIVVKDVDNYLRTQDTPQGNFVAGLDLNIWERDVHNLRNKSFLIVNEQGNILDIIEKQVRSDVICLGLYGFKNVHDFITAYERLNNSGYPITKLYISHIISYLIGYSNRVFRYISSVEYENWGDERLWNEMQRDYALYFVDLDAILIDGILTDSDMSKLIALQNRGAKFIGFTVKNSKYEFSALSNAGIKVLKIVYDCPYSECKEIISFSSDLDNKIIEL